jgi:hypothetical protein
MILHSLHLLLEVNPRPVVLPRHRAVNPLHQAQNRHQEAHLPEKVHPHRLLTIQIIHLQINLLRKVAAVNLKQAKLKQQVTTLANQVLV